MSRLSREAEDFFFGGRTKPAIEVGLATSDGISVLGERYTGSPNISGRNIAPGSDVVSVRVDGVQVILGGGAFHTP